MGKLGHVLCRNLLDLAFGAGEGQYGPVNIAEDLWVCLCSAQPVSTDDTGSISAKEVIYDGYARGLLDNYNDVGWEVTTDDSPPVKANKQTVEFPICTGGSAVARHFALFAAGGEFIEAWGTLDEELIITEGVVPTFGPGELRITLE